MGNVQRLARKQFYNAKAGEKISSQCKGRRENQFTTQRLERKSVLQCTGWREIKLHNAKADKKVSFTMHMQLLSLRNQARQL
jgi:hypothetical protein